MEGNNYGGKFTVRKLLNFKHRTEGGTQAILNQYIKHTQMYIVGLEISIAILHQYTASIHKYLCTLKSKYLEHSRRGGMGRIVADSGSHLYGDSMDKYSKLENRQRCHARLQLWRPPPAAASCPPTAPGSRPPPAAASQPASSRRVVPASAPPAPGSRPPPAPPAAASRPPQAAAALVFVNVCA